jgi:hypothetical protein
MLPQLWVFNKSGHRSKSSVCSHILYNSWHCLLGEEIFLRVRRARFCISRFFLREVGLCMYSDMSMSWSSNSILCAGRKVSLLDHVQTSIVALHAYVLYCDETAEWIVKKSLRYGVETTRNSGAGNSFYLVLHGVVYSRLIAQKKSVLTAIGQSAVRGSYWTELQNTRRREETVPEDEEFTMSCFGCGSVTA